VWNPLSFGEKRRCNHCRQATSPTILYLRNSHTMHTLLRDQGEVVWSPLHFRSAPLHLEVVELGEVASLFSWAPPCCLPHFEWPRLNLCRLKTENIYSTFQIFHNTLIHIIGKLNTARI